MVAGRPGGKPTDGRRMRASQADGRRLARGELGHAKLRVAGWPGACAPNTDMRQRGETSFSKVVLANRSKMKPKKYASTRSMYSREVISCAPDPCSSRRMGARGPAHCLLMNGRHTVMKRWRVTHLQTRLRLSIIESLLTDFLFSVAPTSCSTRRSTAYFP
jgi:hypothetical protein